MPHGFEVRNQNLFLSSQFSTKDTFSFFIFFFISWHIISLAPLFWTPIHFISPQTCSTSLIQNWPKLDPLACFRFIHINQYGHILLVRRVYFPRHEKFYPLWKTLFYYFQMPPKRCYFPSHLYNYWSFVPSYSQYL